YDLVYLASISHSHLRSLRSIVAGHRVPIALTTLGRAYLAALPQEQRAELYTYFASHLGHWDTLRGEIEQAIEHVHEYGFCQASWQPGIVALATPLVLPEHQVYALNISTNRNLSDQRWIGRLAKQLSKLRAHIKSLWLFSWWQEGAGFSGCLPLCVARRLDHPKIARDGLLDG